MLLNFDFGDYSWESLGLQEIQPIHPKGDQSCMFIGRTDAKAETPILWPPCAKSWLIGKYPHAARDWGQEEKGTAKDEMAGWHHGLDGRESEWTLGDGDRQGGLAWCNSRGRKESDTTERLNWTELIKVNITSRSHVDAMYPIKQHDQKWTSPLWNSSPNSITLISHNKMIIQSQGEGRSKKFLSKLSSHEKQWKDWEAGA